MTIPSQPESSNNEQLINVAGWSIWALKRKRLPGGAHLGNGVGSRGKGGVGSRL